MSNKKETDIDKSYAIGRMRFLILEVCICILAFLASSFAGLFAYLFAYLLSMLLISQRLHGIGHTGFGNTWRTLSTVIPLVGLVVMAYCLVAPTGYRKSKTLDAAGKATAVSIMMVLLIIMFYVYVTNK
jgi:hypothetical protein